MLPTHLLEQANQGANVREHIYTLRRTFFGFLFQVLTPATSCREVVRQIQSQFLLQGGRRVVGGTGAWCLARARRSMAERAQVGSQLWHNLCVKVIDGTIILA